jgi:deoxyribodipyrimidine photo-lyase
MERVPEIRIRKCNRAPANPSGDFVLYWMIAFRRTRWNFSLQRAVEWSNSLKKPLVILEALRAGHPWACDRFHGFVTAGMKDNASLAEESNAFYYPYLEPRHGAGKGLLETLGEQAAVVVTDEFPAFFLPRMVNKTARKLRVLLEAVDSNGLLPLRAATKAYPTAYAFRRFLQKSLPAHLGAQPMPDPLAELVVARLEALPQSVSRRWPRASMGMLRQGASALQSFPIDHEIGTTGLQGGPVAARGILRRFLEERLDRYLQLSRHPEEDATSGLSPYLHFGHISAHQVFHEIMSREGWSVQRLTKKATGRREGWWGVGPDAEAFLDQLVTWRELGFNMCAHRDDYDRYESLPDWARETLARHSSDSRDHTYSLSEFEEGRTHDPLWNAAQMQLVRQGRIHNYLRMLWGKKILEWSPTPEEALNTMIELNNKYALDGRDPNSYSGIFWVLGRYDRPWGPERPVLGKVRYMSSENTARKVRIRGYIEEFAP